ncbi:hypothetical protein AVEN_121570-1, partial [Araneus ventricosus]
SFKTVVRPTLSVWEETTRIRLSQPGWSFSPPPHSCYKPSLKANGNGLWLERIIGPPTALISYAISEPRLPSKEGNRLRPAFAAVKKKFLDRPGRIFTNPTLIELRQEIGQYDWLAFPRADDVILCSRTEIITKQAIECGL